MPRIDRPRAFASALLTAVLVAATLAPGAARADFNNGVETFDGPKDLSTWEETVPPTGSIGWNQVLVVDGGGTPDGPEADLTTRSIRLGVGDSVSVELVACSEGIGALYLTDDSEGVVLPALYDDYSISLWYTPSLECFDGSIADGSGQIYGRIFGTGTPPPPPGEPYTIRIVRASATTASFFAFLSDGSLIDSVSTTFTGLPDSLYIAVMSFGRPVTYDNLRAPVPDDVPGAESGGLVALAVLLATMGTAWAARLRTGNGRATRPS